MPTFGKVSRERLETCHPKLQELMNRAIVDTPIDFAIICGFRDQADQDKAYAQGYSKVKWPDGKHNKNPSHAVDVAPVIDGKVIWNDVDLFDKLAAHIALCSSDLCISVEWGGNWSWKDYPHWQLKERA